MARPLGTGGLDEPTLDAIVEAVVGRVRQRLDQNRSPAVPASPVPDDHPASLFVKRGPAAPGPGASRSAAAPAVIGSRGPGVHDDLETAVAAAQRGFEELDAMPLATRFAAVQAMRETALRHLDEMCTRAVQETSLGRVEDKRIKNHVAITKTPGPEYLEHTAMTGDDGLTLMEQAPFGVICSITPCTNPTETIINNAIGMVSAGNAVIFNVHPLAKQTSAWYIALLNEAIHAAGGPRTLLNCMAEPSIDSAQAAMRHKGVRLVVVTGGGAVVQEAFRSGKRAICAGPGNPPVVVDDTADVARAARGIIAGASFDNNVICTCEKEVIAVADICDWLVKELTQAGAYRLSSSEVHRLESTLLDSEGHINRDFVGRNAGVLLGSIGRRGPDELRLLFAELPEDHPFVQTEMLMPIVGVVRERDVDAAIECAVRVEHHYRHTAVMYSSHIAHLSKMARRINSSIFVKNAPNFAGIGAGGEGFTSWTIASPTGEGLTTCRTFSRLRRCTLKDHFRIV